MYAWPLSFMLPLSADCSPSAAGDGGIPFNTQFFHDDFDEAGGFDDVFDGAEGTTGSAIEPGEQDLLAATQGLTRRVRPEFVNYAKRAKRVDVRKLKDNIWKGLDIVVPKVEDQEEEDDAMVRAMLCVLCNLMLTRYDRTWTTGQLLILQSLAR